jgi:hypothetical protein
VAKGKLVGGSDVLCQGLRLDLYGRRAYFVDKGRGAAGCSLTLKIKTRERKRVMLKKFGILLVVSAFFFIVGC